MLGSEERGHNCAAGGCTIGWATWGSAVLGLLPDLRPSLAGRLVEFLLEELLRRKLRQVGRDPDAAPIELEQLDLLVTLIRTEDQADRRLFPGRE